MSSPILDALRETATPGEPAGCGPMLTRAGGDGKPLRQLVFEHVRAAGRAARSDISRAVGVSAGSVTQVAADLIAAGLLREVEGSASAMREPGRGRPPVALEVVPGCATVVGVKLSDEAHTAVLSDAAGGVLAEATLPAVPFGRSLDRLVDEIAALVERLLAGAETAPTRIDGVGIGLSGLIDGTARRVAWSPLLSETGQPLEHAAAERLGAPVTLDNDANMLALAELWFGAGRDKGDFAVVTIEGGVGMGLVIDNRLYRGANGLGMELGHTKVQLDGALCRCGARGCLEAYLADYALAREASTALGRSLEGLQSPQTMLETLYAEAKAGNAAAASIFRRAGRYLSTGLSNVVQLFDPDLIILTGARMQYDYLYADAVTAEMQALSLSYGRAPTRVEIHRSDDMVWARGATALALGTVTDAALGPSA